MKHVTYSERSLLVDDDAAIALIEYARVLALHGQSDTVTLRAIGAEGNVVEVTFLLTPATILMVESANALAEVPDNSATAARLNERIRALSSHGGAPDEGWGDLQASDDYP